MHTLTTTHEAALAHPWQVDDAPADYIAKMLGAIVGIEIVIDRLVGKWKVSQNQPPANQASLVAALEKTGDPMAELVRQHTMKGARHMFMTLEIELNGPVTTIWMNRPGTAQRLRRKPDRSS